MSGHKAALSAGESQSPGLPEDKERHERGMEEQRDEPSSCWCTGVTPRSTRLRVDVRMVLGLTHENTEKSMGMKWMKVG